MSGVEADEPAILRGDVRATRSTAAPSVCWCSPSLHAPGGVLALVPAACGRALPAEGSSRSGSVRWRLRLAVLLDLEPTDLALAHRLWGGDGTHGPSGSSWPRPLRAMMDQRVDAREGDYRRPEVPLVGDADRPLAPAGGEPNVPSPAAAELTSRHYACDPAQAKATRAATQKATTSTSGGYSSAWNIASWSASDRFPPWRRTTASLTGWTTQCRCLGPVSP